MLPVLRPHGQMSDALRTTVFLTLSGGFQDAYTYIGRGQVFANAQTGNIVLLGVHLCDGDVPGALRYLFPVAAFAAGVYVAAAIRRRFAGAGALHWRQTVLALEIALLFAVGFLPPAANAAANVLVSFVCAMQVQAFRKVRGNAYASTMCIGNLRSGVQSLFDWRHGGGADALRRAAQYFGVIGLFAAGAAGGAVLTRLAGMRAVWCCCGLLLVSFLLMFITPPEKD